MTNRADRADRTSRAGPALADPFVEANDPSSLVARFGPERPLPMDCGVILNHWQIAYNAYGTLNSDKSNAVLVCHALTGDQHVASRNPVTGKPGWWETMIGHGKPIDTDRFFVVCANVVGGCLGTTGPAFAQPGDREGLGSVFPMVTIRDMVRAQSLLMDHLGIATLFCAIGGSMGGMQVLQWAATYPDRVFSAVPLATGARHSAQNIAFHEVGRQAVMADPDWRQGRYLEEGTRPSKGLSVARMGRISLTCRRQPFTENSAANCRIGPHRPSLSTPIFRSKATCAIRA